MAGGSMPEQGGGKRGKKPLDAVINVVPAIDLLSCCITFLLYTAVWTQISRLQVQQFGSGAPEPPGEQQKALLVMLQIGERNMVLSTNAGQSWDIPVERVDNELVVKGLDDRLKQLRADYPDAVSVTVSSEDTVPYGDLVKVIDSCVGEGLVSVSVSGV
ncbi:MAG TPA: biopolymer transporter ExbD [Anaeromyxobacter sp.]|nr:biopolymer transporter ExbD [Anaeromyxobacter sp.]